ncbi:helix-turn-helix domain-containing protein [Streptomyces sp. NBC_01525]|uniref:Helix-turn-helix transcriptional regulator n=1 Tax=Streptomyces benahoarensis TaxID=2595054 RepID=A0A553ZBQ2_9ACTN|nr:helix-turn-helix transcriptional regulator [Streptomyces benahoarensis]TSB25301.1 helix-turn-helix transcriptional regulator [Streptomyces benahoarensis]TSB38837.1 helix-turn-helix transcriptional regulator [Streptomyces benahoarensis]
MAAKDHTERAENGTEGDVAGKDARSGTARGDAARQDSGTLADRLGRLFTHMHPPGAPYTNAHVAEEISGDAAQYGGVRLTEQYLSMLRNGRRSNPSPEVLRALAKFFGVPAGYLLGDLSQPQAERVEEEVRFLAAMRDQRVRAIALRSVGLPPDVQESLTTIIDQFRRQMDLPGRGGAADDG